MGRTAWNTPLIPPIRNMLRKPTQKSRGVSAFTDPPIIVKIQLNNLVKLVAASGIKLTFSNYTLEYLADQGFDPQFGARPLKRLIQKEIVNHLSKRILAGDIDKNQPVLVDVFDNNVVFRNEAQEAEMARSNGKKK